MLRDGQFLPEKPINIGGGYAPQLGRKYSPDPEEFTPEEIFMQKALLGDEPGIRLPNLSVGGWLVTAFVAIHLVCWLAR